MPRFVVLEHVALNRGDRDRHWDLMVESEGELQTWALDDNPFTVLQTGGIRLANHRLSYLDYEGPISGDRGEVRQVYRGTCLWLELPPRGRILYAEFPSGERWSLRFVGENRIGAWSSADGPQPSTERVEIQVERLTVGPDGQRQAARESGRARRGVIAVVPRDDRLLVIRRSWTVRAPGAYCFPGGSVEPGESDGDALRRELMEELALEVEPREVLGESRSPWGVELCWMRATVDATAAWRLNEAEVQWAGWMTLAEMSRLDPLLPSNRDFLERCRPPHRLAELPDEAEGFTWGVLRWR